MRPEDITVYCDSSVPENGTKSQVSAEKYSDNRLKTMNDYEHQSKAAG
jgi:hypothetical protein